MAEQIKPCPFCKCESIYDKKYENSVYGEMFTMTCDQCQAEGPLSANVNIAKHAWNQRSYDVVIAKKIEKLEKENEKLKKVLIDYATPGNWAKDIFLYQDNGYHLAQSALEEKELEK